MNDFFGYDSITDYVLGKQRPSGATQNTPGDEFYGYDSITDYVLGRKKPSPAAPSTEPEEKRGVLKEIASSLLSGATQTAESIGATMEMFGLPGGATAREYWNKLQESGSLRRPAYLQEGDVWENPERLSDWRWWVRNLGENLPNMVAMMLPGVAAARYAQAAGWGLNAIRTAGFAGAWPASFVMEAGSQYSQTKEEMRQAGMYDDQTIERVATLEGLTSGTVNSIIEMLPFENLFLRQAGADKFLTRAVKQGFIEGGTESVQEMVNVLSESLGHKPDQNLQNSIGRILEAGIIGGALGAGAGAMIKSELPAEKARADAPLSDTSTVAKELGQAETLRADVQEKESVVTKLKADEKAAEIITELKAEDKAAAVRKLAEMQQAAAQLPPEAIQPATAAPAIQPAPEVTAAPEAPGPPIVPPPGAGPGAEIIPPVVAIQPGMTQLSEPAGPGAPAEVAPIAPQMPPEATVQPPSVSVSPEAPIAAPGAAMTSEAGAAPGSQVKTLNDFVNDLAAEIQRTASQRAKAALTGARTPVAIDVEGLANNYGIPIQQVDRIAALTMLESRGEKNPARLREIAKEKTVEILAAPQGPAVEGAPAPAATPPQRPVVPAAVPITQPPEAPQPTPVPETQHPSALAENADNNIRNITDAMLATAPRYATLDEQIKAGARHDLSISQDISTASEKFAELTRAGRTAGEYKQQIQLSEAGLTPEAKAILEIFDRHRRSPQKLINIFNNYAELVDRLGDPKQATLFEQMERPTKAELLQAALNIVEGEEAHAQITPFKGKTEGGEAPGAPAPEAAPEAAARPAQAVETGGRAPAAVETKLVTTPANKIAEKVASALPGPITKKDLISWADEAFGGTQAEGKYHAKQAFDALEAGINRYLERSGKFNPATATAEEARADIEALKKLQDSIPTQTTRSEETDAFQQFSTPPALAYTANWVANLKKGDVYLEPSAGTGNLAVFGKIAGVDKLYVNELSQSRAAILKEMGFDRVFTENAEQLNNVLPEDVKPTVIVMNPPFSATAGRLSGKKTKYGARHVEQALKKLSPNGRLVAIVGRGMAADKPAFADWWQKIKKEYNVLANVGINGEEYRKFGTTFDNQILVIDKTGPTVKDEITGRVEKVEDLIPLLEGVRDERRNPGEREQVESRGEKGPEEPGRAPVPGIPVQPPARPVGAGIREVQGGRAAPRQPGEHARVESGESERPPGEVPERRPERTGRLGKGEGRGGPGAGTPVELRRPAEGHPAGLPEGTTAGVEASKAETKEKPAVKKEEPTPPEKKKPAPAEKEEKPEEKVEAKEEETLSEAIYSEYKPQEIIPEAKKHPGKIVESAAMASVPYPEARYRPNIPPEVINQGKLSNIQLEPVVYAGQAHQDILPSGERKGYMIGDGTGLGKGREIAAIIWDNYNQGRKKAVWLSQNRPLVEDAKRDVRDLGWNPDLVFDVSQVKLGAKISRDEGIAFISYDTLRSENKTDKAKGSRIDQLIDWLGKDFDGVIAFDESHNMGNAIDAKVKSRMKKASQKALAGVELQARLPNARVVYASATGATEVMNLAYADRLGLWGPKTPFPTKIEFAEKISAGGIAAMEIVARDMKARGVYCARSLSYEGVRYERLTHNLTKEQEEIYNELARAWQLVLANMNTALQLTNIVDEKGKTKNGRAKAALMSQFWSSNQRFWNQIITSMQMPTVIQSIEKDLEAGHCAVLQLVNTNEAAQDRALARMEEGDEFEDLDLTPREQLIEYVSKAFPVMQYEEYEDENGNVRTRPVKDADGKFVENSEAVALREELLTKLGTIRVPDGPLEILLNHFGADKVAEVTGRTKRLVYKETPEGKRRVLETWSKAKSSADVDAFMNDKKSILVFSYAGGTGRSYHADLTAKNQRLRRHYVIQPGWRADRAVQGMGRTHRSNQAQAPEDILVETNLKGHKRFISSIARRLDQLGALTKGQRQTGNLGLFSARDNLESREATLAIDKLTADIYTGNVPDITVADFEEKTGIEIVNKMTGALSNNIPEITQFLNRILNMEIDYQNKLFDAFSQRLDEQISIALQLGNLDIGVETVKAKRASKVREEVVYRDPQTKAETKYVELDVVHDAKSISFAESTIYADQGYARNIKSGRIWALGRPRIITDPVTGTVKEVYLAVGVNHNYHTISIEDLKNPEKYQRLGPDAAQEHWEKEYAELPKEVHEKMHMITGALLPIWDRLPELNVRVRRIKAGKEVLLGRLIPAKELADTLTRLGATAGKMTSDPGDIFDKVYYQNCRVELANRWKIRRAMVGGEDRIEIIGPQYYDMDELKKYGAFTERIQYVTRIFIPTNKDVAVNAIKEITETRPVIRVDMPYGVKKGEITAGEVTHLAGEEGGIGSVREGAVHYLSAEEAGLKKNKVDIDTFFEGKVPAKERGEKQNIILTGGLPAAGKTTMIAGIDTSKHVISDSDRVKEAMGMSARASEVHEESSVLAKQILKKALDEGYHVIYDSQLANYTLADDAIEQILRQGGNATILFQNIDADTSIARAAVRKIAGETERQIPDDLSIKGYNYALPTFIALYKKYKGNPNVIIHLYDNNTDFRGPVRVFSQEGGKITVYDKMLFDKLMNIPYSKITGKRGEIRYERTNKETRESIAAKRTAINKRINELLNSKGVRELPGPEGAKGIQAPESRARELTHEEVHYIPAPEREDLRTANKIAASAGLGLSDDRGTMVYNAVVSEPVGSFKTSTSTVRTAKDAFQIAQNLNVYPQEQLIAIVTDAKNRVISVIRHTMGTTGMSLVEPGILAGQVLNIPEAKNVWFAHQHPSGHAELSEADRRIYKRLKNIFKGSAVKVQDSLAVGTNGYDSEEWGVNRYITTIDGTEEVPVVERRWSTRAEGFSQIQKPEDVADFGKKYLPKGGVILADKQNVPAGLVTLGGDYAKLRGQKQNELLRAIERTNASAMFVYEPGREIGAKEAANILKFSRASDVLLQDIIDSTGSFNAMGKMPAGYEYEFYALTPPEAVAEAFAEETKYVPTLEEVQAIFKGQEVTRTATGNFRIRTKHGGSVEIRGVDYIDADTAAINLGYARGLKEGEKVAGKYQDGVIYLNRNFAGRWTLAHESVHFMEDAGIISRDDVAILRQKIKALAAAGKFTPENPYQVGGPEDRAKWVSEQLGGIYDVKTPTGKILTKIREFIDRVMEAFGHRTADAIIRDIQSGRIYDRVVTPGYEAMVRYQKLAPAFYSRLQRAVEMTADMPKKTASLMNWLAKRAKPEEIKWLGVEDWIKEHERNGEIDRKEFADFIRANQVELSEIVRGDEAFMVDDLLDIVRKYDTAAVEDIEKEYRFLKATAEDIASLPTTKPVEDFHVGWREKMEEGDRARFDALIEAMSHPGAKPRYASYTLPAARNYKELLIISPQAAGYESPHWTEKNVIGHVRFNDRLDATSGRVLFIEEVQSDLHQEGKPTEAPFAQSWPDFLMKRMIRWAAENGYSKLAWTTGDTQTERYDLRRHIDTIVWNTRDDGLTFSITAIKDGKPIVVKTNLAAENLPDVVGKDVASRIIDRKGRVAVPVKKGYEMGELKGTDLKVGGEGMRAFYDRALVGGMEKYVKQWGAKVVRENMPLGEGFVVAQIERPGHDTVWTVQDNDGNIRSDLYDTEAEALAEMARLSRQSFPAWSITLTPEMKEDVLLKGQPYFALFRRQTAPEVTAEMMQNRSFVNTLFETADLAKHKVQVEVWKLQKELQALAGEPSRRRHALGFAYDKSLKRSLESDMLDRAMMVYRDLKNNPDKATEFKAWARARLEDPETKPAEKLKVKKQLEILERAEKLTPEQMAFTEKIGDRFEDAYNLARAFNIVQTHRDNYVRRLWRLPEGEDQERFRGSGTGYGFKVYTTAAKERVLPTILDGWMNGYELRIEGLTNSYQSYLTEVQQIIANRAFIERGVHLKDPEGNPIFSTRRLPGYEPLNANGFQVWRWAGAIEAEKSLSDEDALVVDTYGRKFFATPPAEIPEAWAVFKDEKATRPSRVFESEEEARDYAKEKGYERIEKREAKMRSELFEKQPLYAPRDIAEMINKITATDHWFTKMPLIQDILRLNQGLKTWILFSSFFHHQAGVREWVFGVPHASWKDYNPITAYKRGLQKTEILDPIVTIGIKNGLTLGEIADWSENALREKKGFTERLVQYLGLEKADKVIQYGKFVRETFADSLFKRFFAGLKAEAFSVNFIKELEAAQKAYQEGKTAAAPNPDLIAEKVARLVNSQFGGLHLKRRGRNPTTQKVFQLLALAPDWTESNYRTVTGMIPGLDAWIDNRIGDIPGPPGMEKIYRRFWGRVLLRATIMTLLLQVLLNRPDDLEEFYRNQLFSNRFTKIRWTELDVTNLYRMLGIDTEGQRKTFSLIGHYASPLRLLDLEDVIKAKGSPATRVVGAFMTGSDWQGKPYTDLKTLLTEGKVVKKSPYEEKENFMLRFPSTAVSQLVAMQPIQVGHLIRFWQGEEDALSMIVLAAGGAMHTAWRPKLEAPIERGKGEDPVYDEAVRLHEAGLLKMAPPGKYVAIGHEEVEMSKGQYMRYLERSSDIVRRKLEAAVQAANWQSIPDKKKAEIIRSVVLHARRRVRSEIKREMAMELWKKKQQEAGM